MLAMNDVLFKAEAQLKKNSETEHILDNLSTETIRYEYANAEFPLTPSSFWEIFTAPSLDVMLHYSVNSFIDKEAKIRSPLAIAAIANGAVREVTAAEHARQDAIKEATIDQGADSADTVDPTDSDSADI